MKIVAVIPVHNRADLLDRLLRTIRGQTVPFDEIVVVDNGSTQVLPTAGCRVVSMGGNAGFARAVNAGWRSTDADCVAILNSDVELALDWAEELVAGAGNWGFATGLILNATDRATTDGTYDLMSRGACAWRAGHGERNRQYEASRIAIAPGTACLFRREVLERMHGFDESFGSYLEDVDLGLRCLRAGISGRFVPNAVAWHHGSATLGRWNPQVVRLISRNQVRLVCRHYDRTLFRSCLWPILVGQLLWGAVALRHGAAIAWLCGKVDGLREFRLDATPCMALRRFLNESEREIHTRGHDSYWRWYFRFVRHEAQ